MQKGLKRRRNEKTNKSLKKLKKQRFCYFILNYFIFRLQLYYITYIYIVMIDIYIDA